MEATGSNAVTIGCGRGVCTREGEVSRKTRVEVE